MGIKGLMKLLQEEAPNCLKVTNPNNYTGRTIAIDASMQLYQFMSMIRTQNASNSSFNGQIMGSQLLANEAGEVTSHILGFFHRTINLLEKGIKPVFVFDGKPPDLKLEELMKRKSMKAKAAEEIVELEKLLKEAKEVEDKGKIVEIEESIVKAQKKNLSVTKEHNYDVQKLLKFLGIPFILAPCEAEAQCAELNKSDLVWAVATEDMDALTFSTKILIRNLTYAPSRKLDVYEIHHDKILSELELSQNEFIDLCILCGCDYCPSIKGIGPKNALKLIKQHKTIEKVVDHLKSDEKEKSKSYSIPEELTNSEVLNKIRSLFLHPEVKMVENEKAESLTNEFFSDEEVKFEWKKPDEEQLIAFLVGEKGFDITRVQNALKRLEKSREKTSQLRMDSFFKPMLKENVNVSNAKKPSSTATGKGTKRKLETKGKTKKK